MDTNNIPPYAAIAGAIAGVLVGVGWTWLVGRRTRTAGQASFLSASIAPPASHVTLLNASDLPVFGVVVWFVAARAGLRIPMTLPMLPPGGRELEVPGPIATAGPEAISVEVAFSDVTGLHWLRHGDGSLESLRVAPLRHYGLDAPHVDATDPPGRVF